MDKAIAKLSGHVVVCGAGTTGMHVVAVADLNVPRARTQLATAGWAPAQYQARSLEQALADGGTAADEFPFDGE